MKKTDDTKIAGEIDLQVSVLNKLLEKAAHQGIEVALEQEQGFRQASTGEPHCYWHCPCIELTAILRKRIGQQHPQGDEFI